MAFRKRNIAVGKPPSIRTTDDHESRDAAVPGVKPSPLTSHPVTSTGISSLDDLLGGHSGFALGSSLLIEESGTTDFAGALLRFYAAEGICQGHTVHVVGAGDGWVRELPGVAEDKGRLRATANRSENERMKIAWRYEKLGQAGERVLPDRSESTSISQVEVPFCHSFDLSKRLALSANAAVIHIPIRATSQPLDGVLQAVLQALKSSPAASVHRLVIPIILSPALWPPNSSQPDSFLRFLHSLRSILVQYSSRLTAMITLPLELHPRTSGLVRWAELLSDGVFELTPFPHLTNASNSSEQSSARSNEEQPQGMLKVHKLPVATERGEGGAGAGNSIGDDLAFTISRRKFVIKPFSLPPLEGDQDAQGEASKLTGKDVEF